MVLFSQFQSTMTAAQNWTYSLMELDLYIKFLRSPFWEEYQSGDLLFFPCHLISFYRRIKIGTEN